MNAQQRPEHVEVRRTIGAPVERVYKAWTDPASVQRWFAPKQIVKSAACDVRVGGAYRLVCATPQGKECACHGEYVVVEENRALAFTWNVEGSSDDVRDTLVTVRFARVEGGTEVSVRHERLPTESARRGTDQGWTEILAVLEQLHAIDAAERRVQEEKKRLVQMRKALPRMPVLDATLTDVASGAPVALSALFGGKQELMIVHNMGKGCAYCTLWADGFNGVHQHLSDRAAFIVLTPDEPSVARAFAASRGWGFRLISGHGTAFIRTMGFEPEPGRAHPGISTLVRTASGAIERTAYTHFGPWDDYCGVWAMIEMLEKGENAWAPKYAYGLMR
ncbi:MAG: SRPBCC domain-containing protein [Phycisphaerales bacterium]|nr:SRPBCC domain-containing protein [Phycisphaerales bacterium]